VSWRLRARSALVSEEVVLRTFLQIPNASIGKPTLISIAIISLAAIVVLVAVSFKNQLAEEELIGALPIWPPAGPIEVQPMRPLSASTAAVPPGDAETIKGSSGASRELIPSPRPRPMHKPPPRQGHKIRNIPDNVLPILLAGSIEVQPVRPPAALMAAPHADDAETAVQDSVIREQGRLLLPAGAADIQLVEPLAASTTAPSAGHTETAMGSSGAWRELVPSPRPRPAQKSRPRQAHNIRNRSNYSVAKLPPAGPTEVQPMRPLSASTAAMSAGDAETAMQSSGTSRKLVPLPRPRPVHKPRPRQTHNIRNDADITDAVAILKDLRDPSQIDRAVKDNPSNVFLLLMAEIRRASHETGRLIEKLIDEIEPPTLPKELNYARASRAQLEAYRVDLEAAEGNAMAAMSRFVALLESEREKVEVVVRSLDVDDRYIHAALSGIDKRQAQSTDLTSKMFSANAELYRATAGYVALLIEQFEHYKVSTNGHFMFSSQSIADRYDVASKQIDDAIKRISELEEERKNLAQFQQEQWERFASGN
jgi:hypothetical protein